MSWILRSASFRDQEKALFSYNPSEAIIFRTARPSANAVTTTKRDGDQEKAPVNLKRSLSLSSEWNERLDDFSRPRFGNGSSEVNVILAGTAAGLSTLPFSKDTFSSIAHKLHVHSSIARVINRNKSCHFGRIPYEWVGTPQNEHSIVYNCRTSDTWENDMALSVTYFPQSMTTNAVWFGCGLRNQDPYGQLLSDADIITGRLSNFDGPQLHPMLLPTIFAEFERDRLTTLSRANSTELVRRLHNLAGTKQLSTPERAGGDMSPRSGEKSPKISMSKALTWFSLKSVDSGGSHGTQLNHPQSSGGAPGEAPSSRPKKATIRDSPTVLIWLRLSELRNGIENWRNQLMKMINHTKELDETDYCIVDSKDPSVELRISAFRSSGDRIMGRLQELVSDCDEATRDCSRALEGMALANQLETNIIGRSDAMANQRISESSLHLAKSARRDSEIMKPIAVLGMVFLPGMFTSSFFSIGFFEYKDDKHLSAQQFIWIWACVTLIATVVTILVFRCSTARRLKKMEGTSDGDMV